MDMPVGKNHHMSPRHLCVALAVLLCSAAMSMAADQKVDPAKVKVGDKVELNWAQKWIPATVTKKINDQMIMVKRSDTDTEMAAQFGWLRLPAKGSKTASKPGKARDVDDPFALDAEKAVAGDWRTWTDRSGKFKVKAKLLKVDGEKILLRREDDKEISVAFEKLVDGDQKYVADVKSGKIKLAADLPDAEEPSEDASSRAPSNRASTAEREIELTETDLDSAKVIDVSAGALWTYEPEKVAREPLKPARVPLQAPPDIFEEAQRVLLLPKEKKAYVVFINHAPASKQYPCRLQACDLEHNKLEAAGVFGTGMAPLDIAPDGSRWVARGEGFGSGWRNELRIYTREKDKSKAVVAWEPYSHHSGNAATKALSGEVTWATFVDPKHLLTMSQAGELALWEVPACKPVYVLRALRGTIPGLSAGRQYLTVATSDGVAIVRSLSGEVAGVLQTDMNFVAHALALSDYGTRLALRQPGRLCVWDLQKQELAREFPLDPNGQLGPAAWIDDNYLLTDGLVVDVERRIPVWNYTELGKGWTMREGQLWCLAKGLNNTKPVLTAATALPRKATDPAPGKKADDLLIISPGIQVALDFSGAGPDAEKARAEVTARLEKNRLTVSPSSKVRLVGTIQPGKTVPIQYRSFGALPRQANAAYTATEQVLSLSYVVGDETVWKYESRTSPPAVLHLEKGETIEQALARSMKQEAKTFGMIWIPPYVATNPVNLSQNKSATPAS